MRVWTVHMPPIPATGTAAVGRAGRRPPVLVREGFAWGAFLFGPFWLLAQRAWLAGGVILAFDLLVGLLAPDRVQTVVSLATAVLVGLLGRDMVRWTLERRGYVLSHVLAARDEEGALGRLLSARPDLVPSYAEQLR